MARKGTRQMTIHGRVRGTLLGAVKGPEQQGPLAAGRVRTGVCRRQRGRRAIGPSPWLDSPSKE